MGLLTQSYCSYVPSTIWTHIKEALIILKSQCKWNVGAMFWHDNWLVCPIVEVLNLSGWHSKAFVLDLIGLDGSWQLLEIFRTRFPYISNLIEDTTDSSFFGDTLVWMLNTNGVFSIKGLNIFGLILFLLLALSYIGDCFSIVFLRMMCCLK